MTLAAPESVTPQPASRVHALTLTHFRNHASFTLSPGGESVVLLGPNGAGKTNILEAISLLTPGRGLRRAAIAEMDPADGAEHWTVAAEIDGPRGRASIGTKRESGRGEEGEGLSDKRLVRIDGKTLRGQADLARYFSILWLTPQMDNLFLEGGTARRKFIDRLVYSFDPDHAARVNAYDYAMRERNRLLQPGFGDPAWLSGLEHKMAEQGAAIAGARLRMIEGLNRAITLATHSFAKAVIAVDGFVENALQTQSALQAQEQFRETLAQMRNTDARAGRALQGIHRSQVAVTHAENRMPAEKCSTGEQKALLLSITLAQARAGAARHGHIPALLLDEVSSHLDAQRRGELYAEIVSLGAQAWYTGTDASMFENAGARPVRVGNGIVLD